MLPSLDNLRCFEAAARHLSFRGAASAVGLTPAALGQRIRQLEEQVGAVLFRRTTRTVVLTPAGLALLPKARAALEAAADCVRAATGGLAPAPTEITLGTRWELGVSFLVPNLEAWCHARPGLALHLYFASGPDLLLRVRSEEIDCAVTSTRLNDPRLGSVRLHREDFVFVGAAALLRRKPVRRDADTAGHTLIDAGPELPLLRNWRDAAGGRDLRFARVMRVGSVEGIRRLVLAGSGLAVLPEYLVRDDLRAKRLRVVLPEVVPLFDYFRLIFRIDDPRRALYDDLAALLVREPLRAVTSPTRTPADPSGTRG